MRIKRRPTAAIGRTRHLLDAVHGERYPVRNRRRIFRVGAIQPLNLKSRYTVTPRMSTARVRSSITNKTDMHRSSTGDTCAG
jgi:hypothetical protein